MQDTSYRYLFPYEKIPHGVNILIYGAGVLGQEYLKQLLLTGYCKVVGFVDRNYEKYPTMVVPVYAPEKIRELNFDYVVLALRTENWLSEIKRILAEQGVCNNQIVYALEREEDVSVISESVLRSHGNARAYEISSYPIALLISGGIGDMVIQKRFVAEIVKYVPDAKIDIYVVQNESFPKWLYSDCTNVQNIISDLGIHYSSFKKLYGLSVSIYGSSFMRVDHLDSARFKTKYPTFAGKMQALQTACEDENISLSTPDAIAFHRRTYNGYDCYSWYSYGDIFPIKGRAVSIPSSCDSTPKVFQGLPIHNYITINTGNGSCKDGNKIAKAWPHERFEKTALLFKKKYPHISIVQIGTKEEKRLANVDFHFMGESFDIIACILKNTIFHLDIEGGLVHLATQIGTKCIVLWGPTVASFFAYAENINIRRGNCHDCAGLYRDINKCARDMEKPECMYSITPEIVLEEIDKYMETVDIFVG